jgi:hypothetical protein
MRDSRPPPGDHQPGVRSGQEHESADGLDTVFVRFQPVAADAALRVLDDPNARRTPPKRVPEAARGVERHGQESDSTTQTSR